MVGEFLQVRSLLLGSDNDGIGYRAFDVNNLAAKAVVKGDVLKDGASTLGAKNFAFNNGQGNQT